jgi:hypothetical protein
MAQDLFVEADAAVRQSPEYGAGAGDHLPVGTWSGVRYRAAMRFPILTGGWGIATRIVSATLTFYISDFQHVGPRNSSIYVRRCVTTDYWTEAAGSQSCESGFSAGNTTQWSDLSGISATDQATFSSGTTPNAAKSVDVTDIVEYYRAAGTSKIVFFFDQVSSSDYTEIWADEKTGYAAHLYIVYESDSPPTAPTLNTPAAGSTVVDNTPTFSWTHNDPQGDPQSQAEFQLYDAGGVAIGAPVNIAGTTATYTPGVALTRGTTYQFAVRTSDAVSGWGPYSTKRTFTVKALPVVTIPATRKMVFASGAPRLRVEWTCDQPQTHYRVQTAAPVYDSGWVASAAQFLVLSAVALTDNVAVNVTVSVRSDPFPLEGSASRSFTPRYGLTTHRKDLGAAPTGWGSVAVTSSVPTDATLQIEYGSSTSASATPSPNVWYTSLSSVPFARYLFWRAWFIPSSVAGPTLDKIDIPTDQTVTLVDKWGTTKDTPGLVAPYRVDPNEYVYGTRAIAADVSGAGPFSCYSYGIKVRAGRSYILTGLMRSVGNSGACIRLQDAANNVLIGGGITVPVGNMETEVLTSDRDWYTADQRDTYRYKTPVWVATSDMTVYVVLRTGGTAGAKAWFDAVKLEESTVATPWSPGAVGATIVDAGGVQVDASKGGVFRLRGSAGGARDVVESDVNGLRFGGDANLYSPSANVLKTDDRLDAGSGTPSNIRGVAALMYVFNGTLPGSSFQNLYPADQAAGISLVRVPFNCEVVAVSVSLLTARTAGTLSAQVYNNSTTTLVGPAAVIDGTTTNLKMQSKVLTGTPDLSANQQMLVRVITSAFTPVLNNVVVTVWLAMVAE